MMLLICLNKNFLLITVVLVFVGCSKESNIPVTPENQDNYIWVHLNNDSSKVVFNDLAKFNAEGEEAIKLNLFIDSLLIPFYYDKNSNAFDSRYLYSYQIVGDDGFCASNKGYCNNIWGDLQLGYILISGRRVIFPDDKINLPGAYNVKSARHIYIYRKVDLAFTDSTLYAELRNNTTIQVTNLDGNQEQAIPLSEVVANVVNTPDDYKYNILSLDNFGPSEDMTWEEFKTGYWLLSSGKTMFTDTSLSGGSYKLKVLEKILIK